MTSSTTALTTLAFSVILNLSFVAHAASAEEIFCEPEKLGEKYPAYANKIVKIGINSTYPPFSYNDPDNIEDIIGLDQEIVEHAMDCAGLKFEYINGPHQGLYPTLFSGSLDVMVSNIFYRPDRGERAGFVLYMLNGQSLVVQKGNPKSITSPEAMCGNTATGSHDGTSAAVVREISANCVAKGKPEIDWIPAPDQEPAFRALANERADMVMDGTASASLRTNSSSGQNYEVAFTLQTGVKSGFMVPKGNQEMLEIIASGMRDLWSSGRLAELMTKYGLQEDWIIPIEIVP